MRAYLTDPNGFKTLYPTVAEFVRKVFNRNPDLTRATQFNSAAGAAVLTGYSATDDPRVKSQPETRKTPGEKATVRYLGNGSCCKNEHATIEGSLSVG